MYGEDNTPVWQKELTEKYKEYRQYFRDIYPKWKEWRDSQMEARWYTTKRAFTAPPFFVWVAHGDVVDQVTGASIKYEADMNSIEDYFKNLCLAIQERMLNKALAEMAGTLASTFLLHAYLPGRENDPPDVDPNLATFSMGPYSQTTLGLWKEDDGFMCSTDVSDQPGFIKQIYVREWNAIDGLQFIYADHEGNFIGNPDGGAPQRIDVGDARHFSGLRVRFAKGIMCRIEIVFSDGSSTGNLGNRGEWSGLDIDATVDSSYELVGGSFKQGYGPSNSKGIAVIKLQFQHASLSAARP